MNSKTFQTKLNVSEVTNLLGNLCVDLGFCLPPEGYVLLLETPPEDIDTFTDIIFLAEGMNPQYSSRHLYRRVRAIVAEAFQLHHENQEKILLEDSQRGMRFEQKNEFKKRENLMSDKFKKVVAKSKRNKTL